MLRRRVLSVLHTVHFVHPALFHESQSVICLGFYHINGRYSHIHS